MPVNKLDFNSVNQERKPYSMILNKLLQTIPDQGTLATYCYLCSLPPDWRVNKEQIMKRFGIGKDKLKSQLAWLSKNKLIKYITHRNSNGTVNSVGILVTDGIEFCENIQNDIDLYTDNLTGGGQITRVANHPAGKSARNINNIYITNKNKKTKALSTQKMSNPRKKVEYQAKGRYIDDRPKYIEWGPDHPNWVK
jgi:hypothetical protein